MNDSISFGRWIRRLRNELDLTQEALAEQVGCATQTIRKIESGERRPSVPMAERLAQVLEVAPEERAAFLKAARAPIEVMSPPDAPASLRAPEPTAHRQPLPTYATRFIGRDAELTEIDRLLHDPASRLITLVGPGGIGKTRLATEAATRSSDSWADGVVFVSLAPLNSAKLLAPAIGDAFGIKFAGPDQPATQLVRFLREKEALIVLDNVEQISNEVDLLATLIDEAPRLKLIVTSRVRLHLQGEWVIEIGGLCANHDGSTDAIDLFVERARRVRHDFQLTPADFPAVAEICRLVDCMPLGIELAATWTRLLSPQEIVEQINDSFDFLESSVRGVPDRHRSLRAVFEHSWALLSEDEQRALRRLSVFRSGFRRSAAQQVVGASLPLLAALVDKSLLRRSTTSEGLQRYDLHELVRQYAAERLAEAPAEQETTLDRHGAYYTTLLAEREAAIKSAQAQATVEELRDELDNIRAAWERAVTHGRIAEIARARQTLHWFFETHTSFEEGEACFGRAIALLKQQLTRSASNDLQAVLIGQLLGHQGFFAARSGQFGAALDLLRRSTATLRQQNDSRALGESLLYLGLTQLQMGALGESRAQLEESLRIFRALDDQWNLALNLLFLGALAHASNQFADAQRWLSEALQLWKEIGYPRTLSMCMSYLGIALFRTGAIAEAETMLQQSLGVCVAADDRLSFATALFHLGLVAQTNREYTEARYLFEESLTVFREVGNPWDIARALNQLGATALSTGALADARRSFLQAIAIAKEAQALPDMIYGVIGLATVLITEGQREQALELAYQVVTHPTCTTDLQVRARQIIDEIEPTLEAATSAAIRQRAERYRFAAVVADLQPRPVKQPASGRQIRAA